MPWELEIEEDPFWNPGVHKIIYGENVCNTMRQRNSSAHWRHPFLDLEVNISMESNKFPLTPPSFPCMSLHTVYEHAFYLLVVNQLEALCFHHQIWCVSAYVSFVVNLRLDNTELSKQMSDHQFYEILLCLWEVFTLWEPITFKTRNQKFPLTLIFHCCSSMCCRTFTLGNSSSNLIQTVVSC